LLAVSVSTLEPLAGLGLKLAVTPLGNPDATRVTPPVNPFAGVTVMESVLLPPWFTDRVPSEGASMKLGAALTVRAMVVVSVRVPAVPVMVTVPEPVVAVLPAISVRTLELPLAGLGLKLAVTPLGSPEAVNVTPALNLLSAVTAMVSVLLLPVKLGVCGESVNIGVVLTVRAMVVVAVSVPEVPVMVTVTGPPAVAVFVAVSVSTLELVAGLMAKDAVTPLGRPLAARVTAPLNPPSSFTVMVSVVLPPWGTVSEGAVGDRMKPVPTPVTVTLPALPA
jgi:hypothetical protein